MTAKEYLNQIKQSNRTVLSKHYELREIRAKKDGLKSIELSERVKTSATYNNVLDEYMQREEQIISELQGLHNEWWKCRELIRSIKNQSYSDVLRYYYLLNNDWQDVADTMHTVKRNIYRLHGRALQEFRKISGLS